MIKLIKIITISMLLMMSMAVCSASSTQDNIVGSWKWHNEHFDTVTTMSITETEFFGYSYKYNGLKKIDGKATHSLTVYEYGCPENARPFLLVEQDGHMLVYRQDSNDDSFTMIATAEKIGGNK